MRLWKIQRVRNFWVLSLMINKQGDNIYMEKSGEPRRKIIWSDSYQNFQKGSACSKELRSTYETFNTVMNGIFNSTMIYCLPVFGNIWLQGDEQLRFRSFKKEDF